MKTMLIVFFILSLFLLFIVFPFKTRIMSHINILEKKGFYSIKSWRLRLLCGKIYVDKNNKIQIENTNNMIKDRYKDDYMKYFIKNLLLAMEIKKLELFFNGGFKNNSFSSAMMCGSVLLFVDSLYSFLSQQYADVKLFEDIEPTFDYDSFELTFDFVAEISLIKIFISFIKAKLSLRREK